jgi:hypothetical protein
MWNENTARPGNSYRGHSFKIYPQRAKLDSRKNSFSLRTTQMPEYVVAAKPMNIFKNRLDKFGFPESLKGDRPSAKRNNSSLHSVFFQAL